MLKKKKIYINCICSAKNDCCSYGITVHRVCSVEKHESTVIFHVIVRSNYNFDGNRKKAKSRRFSGAASMFLIII